MIHGNMPPLRPLRPFPLIAGLPANWYKNYLFTLARRKIPDLFHKNVALRATFL
jgi:hypothetical protein